MAATACAAVRSIALAISGLRAGDEEAAVLDGGRLLEDDVAGQARPRLVVAQRVRDLDDMGRRGDVVGVQLRDLLDGVEDLGELAGHAADLVVGELEPREARDVEDLLAVDHAPSRVPPRAVRPPPGSDLGRSARGRAWRARVVSRRAAAPGAAAAGR